MTLTDEQQQILSDMKIEGQKVVKEVVQDNTTFVDESVEWKILNKLLLPINRNRINNISPQLFVGIRAETHRAMQLAFTKYGVVSYEGVHEFMQGHVPGQLTAATQGDLETLLSQAVRLAKKRTLKKHGERLIKLANDYNPNDNEVQSALDMPTVTTENDSSLLLGTQAFLGDLHAKKSGDYIFAHTGYKILNRMMGGEWRPKGLIVMAGAPGSGKTTLWINSSKKMAQGYVNKHGEIVQTPSLFLSLEMSQKDLLLKLVADELSIDNTDLASGDFDKILGDDDEDKFESIDHLLDCIERKTAELQQLPLYVIDNGRMTLAEMTYEIRKHVHKYGVRVVAIDYLQLVNHHPTGNANNDLGDVADVMKDIAKRENITIVILSQVNRLEGLEAIRDSGEVQAVADVVMQLLRDDDDGFSNTGPLSSVYIAWWKNRFGAAGRKTPIMFNGSYQRFEEVRSA